MISTESAIQPTSATLSGKIMRNVGFSGLRFLVVGPIPFLLTPFLLHRLGTQGFGTWAVLYAIVGLSTAADLGLAGTLSKHVSEYYANGEFEALNRLLNTGLFLFILVASIIVSICWPASSVLLHLLFRSRSAADSQLVGLLHAALILVAINIVILLFGSIAAGLQRLDVTNTLNAFNLASAAGLGALFVALSWGLKGLMAGYVIAASLTLLLYIFKCRSLLPVFRIRFRYVNTLQIRTIFSFSVRLYLTQLAVIIHNQIEKLYLGHFTGVIAAGWYDIASDSALKVRGGPALLLSPVMPAASELAATQDDSRLHELYFRTTKYLACVGIPVIVFCCVAARRAIFLWLGPGFDQIVNPFRILLVANYLNLMTGPGYMVLVGRGMLWPGMYSAVAGMLLNIVTSLVLVYWFGFAGAVFGTACSLVFASILFMYLLHRELPISFYKVMKAAVLKPALCAAAGCLVIPYGVLGVAGWPRLLVCGLFFAVAFIALISQARFFDPFDLEKLERWVALPNALRRLISLA